MASLIPDLLTLALAGGVLALLVFLMLRQPLAVVVLTLSIFIVTQGVHNDYQFPLHLGGTSFYLLDLLSLAFVSVGVYQALRSRKLNAPSLIVLALLLLLGVHFLRGAADYGVNDAFNKSRLAIYFISPIVYASTVKRWDARLWRLFPIAGLIVIGIACVYYLKDGYHAAGGYFDTNGQMIDKRPITAAGGLLVLESIVLLSVLRWPSRRVVALVALVSAIGLIALQERTVWIAALVAAVIGLGTYAVGRSWNAKQLAIGVSATLGATLSLVFAFLCVHALNSSVHEITKPNSTLDWRIDGWRELISKYHSVSDIVFGLPAGASYDRTIHTAKVTASAHSLYVGYYLRFGIPGVLLLLALGYLLWRRRHEIAARVGLTSTCVGLILLVQFVYGITWELNLAQGLVFGIFVAATGVAEPAPVSDSDETSAPNLEADGKKRITAILTSHERCEKTLACLRSYFAQQLNAPVELAAVLVDDGSHDGTTEAVRALGAGVEIVEGSGDLYWASGMALAEEHALRESPDYLLWLNDDVVLEQDALQRLLDVVRESETVCAVAGALCDPKTGALTYSGVFRHRFHPLRFDLAGPVEEPLAVDTFNGNVVLVPRSVSAAVGPIDGRFSHGSADLDFGLRAATAGITNLVAPGVVGTCPRDSQRAPWLDRSIPVRERAKCLFGRKGLPPRSIGRYLRRHGGPVWPLFWLSPYLKFAVFTLISPLSTIQKRTSLQRSRSD